MTNTAAMECSSVRETSKEAPEAFDFSPFSLGNPGALPGAVYPQSARRRDIMQKIETQNAKAKKLTLNQETLAQLQGGAAANQLRPTLPPGCSC
jgi:hypothetical protein